MPAVDFRCVPIPVILESETNVRIRVRQFASCSSQGKPPAWETEVLPLNYARYVAFPIVYSGDLTVTKNPI
jgi:hypothetical protein